MNYQLWDLESGNWIATRETESEALLLARDVLASDETYYAHALGLVRGTLGSPGAEIVAEGADLAGRVEAASAGRTGA